ncbi:MAG: hypothetical protein CL920_29435 [Deltaproteobacteria bacterium]|nr:hypothetical protein [Deltaproteobacteria bacterium]MBU52835.1 hypothetical protein [Deltaproteobacteria bacterium]
MDSLSGKTIAGKYLLKKLLGEGAMGSVYLAEHTGFQEKRAIKVIKSELLDNEKVFKRFQSEIQMTRKASLLTDHIVSIYDDFGSEQGITYYVMEYLEGDLLSRRILQAKQNPLPIPWIVRVTNEICEAMAAAHRTGILFRDLKPENIFLIKHRFQEDFVKVIDFGIAKAKGQENQTQAGHISGTPLYMSPEQIQGPPQSKKQSTTNYLDARTDIYSLGCVLYEMLTGRPPFMIDEWSSTMDLLLIFQYHLNKQPTPPSELRPDIPKELEKVVLKALEKDRENRFSSMTEFAEEVLLSTAGMSDALLDVSEHEATVIKAYQPKQEAPVIPTPQPIDDFMPLGPGEEFIVESGEFLSPHTIPSAKLAEMTGDSIPKNATLAYKSPGRIVEGETSTPTFEEATPQTHMSEDNLFLAQAPSEQHVGGHGSREITETNFSPKNVDVFEEVITSQETPLPLSITPDLEKVTLGEEQPGMGVATLPTTPAVSPDQLNSPPNTHTAVDLAAKTEDDPSLEFDEAEIPPNIPVKTEENNAFTDDERTPIDPLELQSKAPQKRPTKPLRHEDTKVDTSIPFTKKAPNQMLIGALLFGIAGLLVLLGWLILK